jgi:hypothetical protein
VQENLPPYAGYIDAELPGGTRLLRQQAADYYRDLQTRAQQAAQREGVILTTELVEGDEVQAIMECVQRNQSDLLVLGLHRHSLLFSRLWNHTTHDLVQQLSSSILGFIEKWEQRYLLVAALRHYQLVVLRKCCVLMRLRPYGLTKHQITQQQYRRISPLSQRAPDRVAGRY